MPNTAVRAAAEGLPAINRRKMLLGLAAASTAAAAVTVATPAPAAVHDPLIDAIKAFRDGLAAFSAADEGTEAEMDALYFTCISAPMHVLADWTAPALTHASAIEALRIADDEANLYENSSVVQPMIQAALAFLQANMVIVPLPPVEPARSHLLDLIAAHKAAYAAFIASCNPADKLWCERNGVEFTEEAQHRWNQANDAEERATMAICRFRPTTAVERRKKANYLLKFDGSRHGYGELSEEQYRAVLLSMRGGAA